MEKVQLSFSITSWVDEGADAMAYPSPNPCLSKVTEGRATELISACPLGEGEGGQD